MREAIGFVAVVLIVVTVAQAVMALEVRRVNNRLDPRWEYTVQAGDSLLSLAEQYYPHKQARDVIEDIYNLNLWTMFNEPVPGDVLEMPAKGVDQT